MKSNKNLGKYIIRVFILCSIAIALTTSILEVVLNLVANRMDPKYNILANTLVRPDYQNIDMSLLSAVGGWIEVLDEDFRVIFTKGQVQQEIRQYTAEQLLSQGNMTFDNNYHIGMLYLQNDFSYNMDEQEYFATYSYFTDNKGNRNILVAKIQRNRFQVHFTLLNTGMKSEYLFLTLLAVFALLHGFTYYFYIRLFGKRVNKKIAVPISNITSGLRKITSGNLNTRLDFETENEFVEIRDAFNYMASAMEKAEAEKRMYEAERSLLFSNIAHDLKTPITTITGYSKALAEDMVNEREKQKEYLASIYTKSQRLNQLIDLLFSYAKLNNEQYMLKFEALDIVELVRENAAMLYSDFEDKGIEFDIDLPNMPIIKSIDKLEMSRALTNLLCNGVNHNPKGSRVFLKVEVGKETRIIVADNGRQIPENIVKTLFDPFVLGDKSRWSKGGSGLGLAITKKIIEKHHAQIHLDTNFEGFTKAFVICI